MKSNTFLLICFGICVLLLVACGGSGAPTSTPTLPPPSVPPAIATEVPPPSATSVPTDAPTAVPPTVERPTATATMQAVEIISDTTPTATATVQVVEIISATTPAASGFDGDWEGTSSTDSPISFSVADNAVTFVNINFAVDEGNCQGLSGSYGTSVSDVPIRGDEFEIKLTDDDGGEIEFEGEFTSATTAEGKLKLERTASACGEYKLEATWTATRVPPTVEAAATEETPAAEATLSVNGEKLVRDFFDALNAGSADAALELVSDDVAFQAGETLKFGKAEFGQYIRDQITQGTFWKIDHVQDLDGLVIFDLQVNGNEPTSNNTAALGDGKIELLTLHLAD